MTLFAKWTKSPITGALNSTVSTCRPELEQALFSRHLDFCLQHPPANGHYMEPYGFVS
jgi:hypothetical protein